jgi:hypothetical protein
MPKLFAVCLGGRAERCNTELHDVVFAAGETIEDTYPQLLEKWFGLPVGLHIDSWLHLDVVDGYEITLSETPSPSGKRLFFINLGAYTSGDFAEQHANIFVVAEKTQTAKTRAKDILAAKLGTAIHTDDLYDVDDCIELSSVKNLYISLRPASRTAPLTPVNGYLPLPADIIQAFRARA